MKLSTLIVMVCSVLVSSLLWAQQESSAAITTSPTDNRREVIRQQMTANFPAKEVVSVKAVADNSIYQVEFASGLSIYALSGTEYFFAGNVYQGTAAGVVDLTERLKQQQRAKQLSQLQANEYLSLMPEQGPVSGVVYVFVDVDCYYCQFQHLESQQLLAQGVEVRYLSFNRQKPGSAAYHKVRRTWCSDDPQQALDMLMQGRSVSEKQCAAGLMDKHKQLAQRAGVKRLPAMMTEDGRLYSGLLRAPQIFNLLGIALPDEVDSAELTDTQEPLDAVLVSPLPLPETAQ